MGIWGVVLLSTVAALSPLEPVTSIDLSSQGTWASDVAWLNDDEVLVALLNDGVSRVSIRAKKVTPWVPRGELPDAAPYPELVATDGKLVVIMGAGKRNYMFRTVDGKQLDAYGGGRLYPRGLAVVDGQAVYMGWMGMAGENDTLRRGVLWTQKPSEALSETPIHRIFGDADALKRWRLSTPSYAGSMVALADGIAVMTMAEPGIYKYDRSGKLVEVLGAGDDSLILDSVKLAKEFNVDVQGRYEQLLNRGPMVEDLVATGGGKGVAALVRTASNGNIGWELWYAGKTGFTKKVPLATTRLGPYGHMRCESRGERLACVTNLPGMQHAGKPETAGANPRLFLFNLPK